MSSSATRERVTSDAADMAAAWRTDAANSEQWWCFGLLQLVDYYESALSRGGTALATEAFHREPTPVNARVDASLASAAEYFADRDGWEAPEWARRRPSLDADWFVLDAPEFYTLQRDEAPAAFARRRIYLLYNGLSRA